MAQRVFYSDASDSYACPLTSGLSPALRRGELQS